MSSREAELLLADEPSGTYLLRFSKSRTGAFALAFIHSDRKIYHTLINSGKQGFEIEEVNSKQPKICKSLPDVINHYSLLVLKKPLQSKLPRQPWFQGDLSSEESQELLADKRPGTFLVRFTRSGQLAASFVPRPGDVQHILVDKVSDGKSPFQFKLAGDQKLFESVEALVDAYRSKVFLFPYSDDATPQVRAPDMDIGDLLVRGIAVVKAQSRNLRERVAALQQLDVEAAQIALALAEIKPVTLSVFVFSLC